MSKKILIDSTHSEETRVALLGDDGRLEDYDIESAARKLLKGNVFLAKVTRVEPSLQAAFVDYGGNRHGFLPFSEIHPDYYRIPIADKEALMKEQAELLRRLEEAAEKEEDGELDPQKAAEIVKEMTEEDSDTVSDDQEKAEEKPKSRGRKKKTSSKKDHEDATLEASNNDAKAEEFDTEEDADHADDSQLGSEENSGDDSDTTAADGADDESSDDGDYKKGPRRGRYRNRGRGRGRDRAAASHSSNEIKDDEEFSNPMQPLWNKIRRNYKIQEVIKRGQIMLIQINKEERGNKGAAVTSYITLPGRYCVLMPNSGQGGGVSRKISDRKDRRRMRDVLKSLDVPEGMSVILRTAGVARTKLEIKRDYTYLTRLWNSIRDLTLKSSAPAQIHEEGNLLHRIIRDVYSKDYEEICVAGDDGYKDTKNFMKMMMPSHVKRVNEHKDETPLFIKHGIEKQIEAVHDTTVQLKSGGYLVINPTEALVSIDVNSGRATRERHIEETALKTNLEAAEEIARQMRLRDLAGLVVIDFIDMENRKNNRQVERVVHKALSKDRAKVQYSQISQFGLMELSRQRLRPSMTEKNFIECPHCHGKGIVRTIDGAALTILRAIESEGVNGVVGTITIEAPSDVILYLLNQKRRDILSLEQRYNINVTFDMNDEMGASDYNLDCQRPKQQPKGHNKNHHNKKAQNNNAKQDGHYQRRTQQPADDDQTPQESNDPEQAQDLEEQSSQPSGRKPSKGRLAKGRGAKTKTAGKGNAEKDVKSSSTSTPNQPEDVSEANPAAKKPAARKRKKAADDTADSASAQEASKPQKAAALKKANDDQKTEETPSKSSSRKKGSNDKDKKVVELDQVDASQKKAKDEKPAPKPDYNVISQSEDSAPKKKGWWSRMIEK